MREKIVGGLRIFFKGEKKIRNIILLLVVLGAGYFGYTKYFTTSGVVSYEYATATIKNLEKKVEGSGTVMSVQELNIQQLQNGGKVTAVYVKPGDYVKQGQVIAQLDNRSAGIQLAQARASYDKVVNGATKETLDISKQTVENAKTSYELTKKSQDLAVVNTKKALLNTSLNPIPKLDSRFIPNNPTVSGSYTCDHENEYKISMQTSDQAVVTNREGKTFFINFSSVPQTLDCGLYLSFDVSKTFTGGEWTINIPDKTSLSYASNLRSYETALQNREQALVNASTTIINSELSYNQTVVGARPEDIASAKASLASAQLNYENTIVRAPFAGQIGSVSAAVGQQTNSQAGIATIITKDKLAQISLNEIDIVNVKLGQNVDLSFDAIPGEKFKGTVAQIDTVGVSTSNVVSFAVKISIPNADERIKSGMSVTAEIIVESKENVLTVPSGTIKTEKDVSYVLRKVGNDEASKELSGKRNEKANERVVVEVGMTNDIDTEIISGLQEGERVVSKTNNGGVSTARQAGNIFSIMGGGNNRGFGGAGGGQRTGGNNPR